MGHGALEIIALFTPYEAQCHWKAQPVHQAGRVRRSPAIPAATNSDSSCPHALSGGGVACSDLIFVGGDGCQDLSLFRLRDLEEVRCPSGLTSNARLCGSRWQNELSNRFCETFILVAVGHRARLRFHFVAGVAHCDGKSALAEHKDVIWHISDRCDLRGRNAQKL